MSKKIHIASDHAGFAYKILVKAELERQGYVVEDHGTNSAESCDYPVFAQKLCQAMQNAPESLGILICGTGVGMSIMANRYPHIRAALCSCEFQAKATREHNDANVLCLGERVLGIGPALAIVNAFLHTPFAGGRHAQRIAMFDNK